MLGGSDVIGAFVLRDKITLVATQVKVYPAGKLQRDEESTRRLRVDHLVYGVVGSLEAACADFRERTGISPVIGGVHQGLGTRNAIVALGGADDGSRGNSNGYLELVALDPAQPDPAMLWMGMESVVDRPRIVTWASAADDAVGVQFAVPCLALPCLALPWLDLTCFDLT